MKKHGKTFLSLVLTLVMILALALTPTRAADDTRYSHGSLGMTFGFSNPYSECGTVTLNQGWPDENTCPLLVVPSGTVVTCLRMASNMPDNAENNLVNYYVYTLKEETGCVDSDYGYLSNQRSAVIEDNIVYCFSSSVRGFLSPQTERFCVCSDKFDMSKAAAGVFSAMDAAAQEKSVVNTPTAPADATAYPSTQTVLVDGAPVTFHAYALKDASGNDTNYVKLRDVAAILNGSAAQFEVGWDGAITITTKTAYTPNGSENIANFSGDQPYKVNTSPILLNGVSADLEAITLTDAKGGAYNYFKLRDLGAALGFNVSWDKALGQIVIDPNNPYDPSN